MNFIGLENNQQTSTTMPGLPVSVKLNVPTYHQRLLGQIRASNQSIKSFNPVTRTLDTLYW
jgi:hypothetical protein